MMTVLLNSILQYQGIVKLNGVRCTKWIATLEAFNRTDTYIFHATDEMNPKPLKFEMQGYDIVLTSYYDHYIIDYSYFTAWQYDHNVFSIPQGKTYFCTIYSFYAFNVLFTHLFLCSFLSTLNCSHSFLYGLIHLVALVCYLFLIFLICFIIRTFSHIFVPSFVQFFRPPPSLPLFPLIVGLFISM